MILGRNNELQYLNTVYAREGNQLVILYGQKNIGKTMLINDFIKDKDALYYLANEASERQQLYLLSKQWQRNGIELTEYPTYEEAFIRFAETAIDKKVLVIDEFQHMVKAGTSFMDAIQNLLHHVYSDKQFLIIFCSSSIGFVENGMVKRIGKAAFEIKGFLKIKELRFTDVVKHFPDYSIQDCILIYSILGGIPGMWQYIDPSLSMKENICKHILSNNCVLKEEGPRLVKEELREGSVYYSILAALAEGKDKLNELFKHTQFSRAKISVYLKNLMELEIVEKEFSFEIPVRDLQRKGIYRISNHFVHFWFRYIYNNFSNSVTMQPEQFFDVYIAPTIKEYCNTYFSLICREYMQNQASKEALPTDIEKQGFFDGKYGFIDYIGQSENGSYIVAFSDYTKPMMTYEAYLEYLAYLEELEKYKIKVEHIYLFSGGGFDEKLTLEAKVKPGLKLIGLDDL